MRFLGVLLFSLCFHALYAQKEVDLNQLKNYIGDSVKVKGKVYGIRYLQDATNTPTFINVGAEYPNQILTIVIWGDVRKKFKINLDEKKYAQGVAVVVGKVELYRDKPQIVIKDPKQLWFIYDEEVSADQIPPIERN